MEPLRCLDDPVGTPGGKAAGGVTIDLGCGRRPVAGAIGLDAAMMPGVDVVADLGKGFLPFRDGVAVTVYARNVLEHLDDLAAVMSDIWRVLAPGGTLRIEVPYYTSVSAYADPTHRRWFTYTTFEHFTAAPASGWAANRHTWFSSTRFHIVARRLVFGRAHRLLGVSWLANRFPALYENLTSYWFPARSLLVDLIKSAAV